MSELMQDFFYGRNLLQHDSAGIRDRKNGGATGGSLMYTARRKVKMVIPVASTLSPWNSSNCVYLKDDTFFTDCKPTKEILWHIEGI